MGTPSTSSSIRSPISSPFSRRSSRGIPRSRSPTRSPARASGSPASASTRIRVSTTATCTRTTSRSIPGRAVSAVEIPEEVWRRLKRLEDAVENGRFIRRDIFDLVVKDQRDDYDRIISELGEIKATLKSERENRDADRKGLRNLVLGALFAAAGSLIVSLIVASAIR